MRIIYILLIWWHVLYVQYEFKYVGAFSLRKNDLLDGEDVKENLGKIGN